MEQWTSSQQPSKKGRTLLFALLGFLSVVFLVIFIGVVAWFVGVIKPQERNQLSANQLEEKTDRQIIIDGTIETPEKTEQRKLITKAQDRQVESPKEETVPLENNVSNPEIEKENSERELKTGSDSPMIEELPDLNVPEINHYLSNFWYCGLCDYSHEAPDYENLLSYAFTYISLNEFEKVQYNAAYTSISKSDINACLERFFNLNVPERSFGVYEYKQGRFYCPSFGYGEIGMPISICDKIEKKDGYYLISFYNVYVNYESCEIWDMNPTPIESYYRFDIEKIQADSFCEIEGQGSCTLKWIDNRLVTLEYSSVFW